MSSPPTLLTAFLCLVYQHSIGRGNKSASVSDVSPAIIDIRKLSSAEENDQFPTWKDLLSAAARLIEVNSDGSQVQLSSAGEQLVVSQCPADMLKSGVPAHQLVDAIRKSHQKPSQGHTQQVPQVLAAATATSTTAVPAPAAGTSLPRFTITDVFLFRLYRRVRVTRSTQFAVPLDCVRNDFERICAHPRTMLMNSANLVKFDGMLEVCKHCVSVTLQHPASIRLTEFGVSSVQRSLSSFSPEMHAQFDQLHVTLNLRKIRDYAPHDNTQISLSSSLLRDSLICRLLQRASSTSNQVPGVATLSPVSVVSVAEDIQQLRPYCVDHASYPGNPLLGLIAPLSQWVRLDAATNSLILSDEFRVAVAGNPHYAEFCRLLSHILPPIAVHDKQQEQQQQQQQAQPQESELRKELASALNEVAVLKKQHQEVKVELNEVKRAHDAELSEQRRRVTEQNKQLVEQQEQIAQLMLQMRNVQRQLDEQRRQSTSKAATKRQEDDDDWSRM